MERGLPASIEAEQFVLGAILLDDSLFAEVAGRLGMADFTTEPHRRVFRAFSSLAERGERIEYLTAVHELERVGDLGAVGGVAFIAGLTDGLPRTSSIESYVRIVADKAGLRRLIAAADKIKASCLDGSAPPAEIIAAAERDVLHVADGATHSAGLTVAEAIEQYRGGWTAFQNPASARKGVQMHLERYNHMTAGLHRGELTLIAARPSHGKTALALGLAIHAARAGHPVVVFSLEMSKESLLGRMVCMMSRVDSHHYRTGHLSAEERLAWSRSATALAKLPIVLDDQATTTTYEIAAKLRREKQRRGLELAIVDYLQLVSSPHAGENRNQEVSAISRAMKLMARDLDIPMVALSQLSRANEAGAAVRRPQLSDLRDSGSLEQDADVVAFIHRDHIYKPDREDLAGAAELLVAKQRNGPTGIIRASWVGRYSAFENLQGEE